MQLQRDIDDDDNDDGGGRPNRVGGGGGFDHTDVLDGPRREPIGYTDLAKLEEI